MSYLVIFIFMGQIMNQATLEILQKLIPIILGAGTIFYTFYKFVIKPIRTEITDYKNHKVTIFGLMNKIDKILYEVVPNGGNSLKDFVVKNEAATRQVELNLNRIMTAQKAIMMSQNIGHWESNEKGEYVSVGTTTCRILQRAENEILGNNWATWLHPDDSERIWDEWISSIEQKREFYQEYRFVLPDGKIQKVKAVAYQILDKDKTLIGFYGTLIPLAS